MKQKSIWNHAVQEGILFLLLGGALLWHGLDGYNQAFIKDWSQSPYLFPVLVAVLRRELEDGCRMMLRQLREPAEKRRRILRQSR